MRSVGSIEESRTRSTPVAATMSINPARSTAAVVVASDVDPRENHLSAPRRDQRGDAAHDVRGSDAGRIPTRVRHDAVGAPVVAAVLDLDVDPRAERRWCGRSRRSTSDPQQSVGHRVQNHALDPVLVRLHHDGSAEGLDTARIQRGQAAGHHDERLVRGAERMPDRLSDLRVRLGGHGAGVDHHDVGVGLVRADLHPRRDEALGDRLALRAVHLAAERANGHVRTAARSSGLRHAGGRRDRRVRRTRERPRRWRPSRCEGWSRRD